MDGLISRGLKPGGGGLKSGILRHLEVFEKFRKLEEIQKNCGYLEQLSQKGT